MLHEASLLNAVVSYGCNYGECCEGLEWSMTYQVVTLVMLSHILIRVYSALVSICLVHETPEAVEGGELIGGRIIGLWFVDPNENPPFSGPGMAGERECGSVTHERCTIVCGGCGADCPLVAQDSSIRGLGRHVQINFRVSCCIVEPCIGVEASHPCNHILQGLCS